MKCSEDECVIVTDTMKKVATKDKKTEAETKNDGETIEFTVIANNAESDQEEAEREGTPKETAWERLTSRCDMRVFAKWSGFMFLLLSPGLNDVIWNDVDRPFDAFLFITGNGYIGDPMGVYVIGNIIVWLMLIFAVFYLMWQYVLNERDQVGCLSHASSRF